MGDHYRLILTESLDADGGFVRLERPDGHQVPMLQRSRRNSGRWQTTTYELGLPDARDAVIRRLLSGEWSPVTERHPGFPEAPCWVRIDPINGSRGFAMNEAGSVYETTPPEPMTDDEVAVVRSAREANDG